MKDMNYIELCHKEKGYFGLYVHYLTEAKRFAKLQWETGDYSSVSVTNKKDKVVWEKSQ